MATKKKAAKKPAPKKAVAKKSVSKPGPAPGKKNGRVIDVDDNGGGITSPLPSSRPPRKKS